MRLIDADALLEKYNLKDATKYGNKDAQQQNHSYSTLMLYEIADMIEDAPTAYDVDKVVEQLEELKAIKDGGIPIINGQEELKLHDREIRNKAVDDFANRLYLKIKSEIDDCADELEWIGEIAKRLKAGDVD